MFEVQGVRLPLEMALSGLLVLVDVLVVVRDVFLGEPLLFGPLVFDFTKIPLAVERGRLRLEFRRGGFERLFGQESELGVSLGDFLLESALRGVLVLKKGPDYRGKNQFFHPTFLLSNPPVEAFIFILV